MAAGMGAQPGPVAGKPFSGTEVRQTVTTLADGTKTNQKESTAVYRDAEGRMRMESGSNVVIYDPVAGAEYTLDTSLKTFRKSERAATSTTQVAIAVTSHGTYSQSSSGDHRHVGTEEGLGSQVVNGISATGTRTTVTIPGSSIGADHDLAVVNERWYSDQLGVLVKSSNSDPRFGTTTYDLTNLSQATPDPGLFKVPQDYQERCSRPGCIK